MLFYESERSDQHNYLYCQRDHNVNFPAHLHHSFEFLCVQSGTLACTLETEQYEVHPGEALLVLPDQIHSYRTIGESQSVLWVFSTDWVPEFISQLGQREFITPVFRMEAAPLMELLWPGGNRCKQLAGLYLIGGAADIITPIFQPTSTTACTPAFRVLSTSTASATPPRCCRAAACPSPRWPNSAALAPSAALTACS